MNTAGPRTPREAVIRANRGPFSTAGAIEKGNLGINASSFALSVFSKAATLQEAR
jgi:hypothetical protein